MGTWMCLIDMLYLFQAIISKRFDSSICSSPLVQAASLAVTKYGASATAVAAAMSTGSNGAVSPQALATGNAQAAAAAVDKGVEGESYA